MWLFLFLLLFCTQKTFNNQKFSKNKKVASEAVFCPAFSEIRENESTENSEKKWKLISDAKISGEYFTANFTDKYAQFRLAKTQESTPRAETIVKKSKIIPKDGQMRHLLYMTFAAPRLFNCFYTKGKSPRPRFHGSQNPLKT